MASAPFDPASMPRFSVIKIPATLDGQKQFKRFVVISHIPGYVYCLKATSQTAAFEACRDCVLTYKKGECKQFEKETVIDPRNQFPISHAELKKSIQDGEFEDHGCLPSDFRERMTEVVKNSRVIEPRKKARLLKELGE